MKAFLLLAGHGTRLRPLTDSVPKCLLPVRGRPLLDIWLDLCARSGITEVLLNLHAHADMIERHLELCRAPVKTYLTREEHLLGSAGTIAANRDWVGPESDFWVIYSDVLTNTDLQRMKQFHFRHGAIATLGLYEVADPSQCGVALTDEHGRIVDFQEKPANPHGNSVFSGLMIAQKRFLDFIPSELPADLGFHVLPRLRGKMQAYPIADYLLDIGSHANYARAQQTWPGTGDSRSSAPLAASSLPTCADERQVLRR